MEAGGIVPSHLQRGSSFLVPAFSPSLFPSPTLATSNKRKGKGEKEAGGGPDSTSPPFIKGDTGTNLFRTPLAEPFLAGTILDLEGARSGLGEG